MAKGSGGTRGGRSESSPASLSKYFISSAKEDLAEFKVADKSASGKLVGNSISKQADVLEKHVSTSPNYLKSAYGVDEYSTKTDQVFRDVRNSLNEKISQLEYNMAKTTGRQKNTYQQAIDKVRRAEWNIADLKAKYNDGTKLGELQGELMKKGKLR